MGVSQVESEIGWSPTRLDNQWHYTTDKDIDCKAHAIACNAEQGVEDLFEYIKKLKDRIDLQDIEISRLRRGLNQKGAT